MSEAAQALSPADLLATAKRALAAGDRRTARRLHEEAAALEPADKAAWIGLAACCRALDDIPAALSAVDKALALEPRLFPALLMRASLLERQGQSRAAGKAYGVALTQAPPDDRLDPATLAATRRARAAHERHVTDQQAFLSEAMAFQASDLTTAEKARLTQFIAFATGSAKHYRSEPTHFYYPGLPEVGFHPRGQFPWIEALEAQTDAIREEAVAALATGRNIVPYIDYDDSLPLDQWAALNRSTDWSAIHLYNYGHRVAENADACPRTLAAVSGLPQPQVQNRSPALMFSILKPRTRIPPHTGVANTRLVVHLPLVVPDGCGFRVGGETRAWVEGRAWVFDDTIEHEAWNDSRRVRVVMICDIWRPELSPGERAQIAAMMSAMDAFDAEPARPPL